VKEISAQFLICEGLGDQIGRENTGKVSGEDRALVPFTPDPIWPPCAFTSFLADVNQPSLTTAASGSDTMVEAFKKFARVISALTPLRCPQSPEVRN